MNRPLTNRDPADQHQLSLDGVWPCPHCKGQGWILNPATNADPRTCLVCSGAGTVNYNPDDTVIPF
jgi:DnaJ-class molecular chaperone